MRVRVFKDPAKYQELVELLNAKASYLSIARHFHCDHTSVIYWARKIGIPVIEKPIEMNLIIEHRKSIPDKEHPILKEARFERVNLGKNYADYQRELKERGQRFYVLPGGIII